MALAGLAAGAVTAALALAALRRAAPALRLVDRPGGRHLHERPTPRIGGLAVAAGVVVGALAARASGGEDGVPWVAGAWSLALLSVGVLDDVLRDRFPALAKLALQTAVAVACVAQLGLEPAWLVVPLLVAGVNAWNFLDHADGLLAATLLAACVAPSGLGLLAPALAGALLVFLLANLARVSFAGDAGSHALGFLVLAAPLDAAPRDSSGAIAVSVAIGSLALADLAVVVARRLARGLAPWRASADHLADRCRVSGRTAGTALGGAALWTLAVAGSALLVAPQERPWLFAGACALVAVAVVTLAPVLGPRRSAG